MGKRTALVIGVMALFACVLATPASAVWTHKGKGELKENASIALKGTVTLTTSAGNVACPAEIGGTLTASSSSGHVGSFTVSKPSECDLTGSLAAICGTNGVTKVEKTGTWTLTADETDITVSSIDLDYTLAGCLIPSFRVQGSSTASLDKASAIGSATLSGTQTLYNSLGEASGSGELKGTLAVTPAGTYGVKAVPLVETKWTDNDEHLGTDGKLTLAGTFSFSGAGGSISCSATIKLLLESSTVEEEGPEGEIESFTVSSPTSCDVTGGYATTCGTNSISGVEQTGTATLTATEEDITISGLSLDYKFKECAITSLRVEGNPTVSVSTPEKISSATFSAGSLQLYNAESEKVGTASAGGSASASPSGTFQLVATPTQHPGDEWTTNGNVITAPTPVEFTGPLTATGALVSGPCTVHIEATIDNGGPGGTGAGVINHVEITTPGEGCPTSVTPLNNCRFGDATNTTTTEGAEWPIAATGEGVVDISNVSFTNHYSAPCAELGVPSTMTAEGELETTYNNESECFELNESGPLATNPNLGPIVVDGEACNTTEHDITLE
jgi:hypothetical protein